MTAPKDSAFVVHLFPTKIIAANRGIITAVLHFRKLQLIIIIYITYQLLIQQWTR